MSELFIQIIAGLVVAIIVSFFSIGSGSHKRTLSGGIPNTKKWKATIVIGVFMIVGGLSLFSNNFPIGGFQNPYAGLGFSIAFLGLIVFFIGRFGRWWSRD